MDASEIDIVEPSEDEDEDEEMLDFHENGGDSMYSTRDLRIPRWLLERYLCQVRISDPRKGVNARSLVLDVYLPSSSSLTSHITINLCIPLRAHLSQEDMTFGVPPRGERTKSNPMTAMRISKESLH